MLILLLGLTPGESMPITNVWDFLSFDKIAHFFVFAVLVFLFILGFSKQYTFLFFRYYAVPLAIGISILYGLIIEIGQTFIPERGLEPLDILANTIGVFAGWFAFYMIYKI
ncbi:VanZ family protein [Marivirga sp.]|uniref:VanZ family protein n=1 Tax=Marivirga sp. TaxID=2018662 RepID=UPI0025E97B67|nr:VanZ family protein [Marivirga sp.]